jgi:hypothetical protein
LSTLSVPPILLEGALVDGGDVLLSCVVPDGSEEVELISASGFCVGLVAWVVLEAD